MKYKVEFSGFAYVDAETHINSAEEVGEFVVSV